MKTRAAYVTVARILRPHGRRGEVAAEILTDFPQRLTRLKSAELYDPRLDLVSNGCRATPIRTCWLSHSRGGQAIFHFQGADSMDDAKRLVGFEVQIPFADRAPLADGRYYVSDLAGCAVVTQDGREIGHVREVQFVGEDLAGTPNLVIPTPQGDLYIPLAQDICINVDPAAKRITIAPPEGLLELNAGS